MNSQSRGGGTPQRARFRSKIKMAPDGNESHFTIAVGTWRLPMTIKGSHVVMYSSSHDDLSNSNGDYYVFRQHLSSRRVSTRGALFPLLTEANVELPLNWRRRAGDITAMGVRPHTAGKEIFQFSALQRVDDDVVIIDFN